MPNGYYPIVRVVRAFDFCIPWITEFDLLNIEAKVEYFAWM